MGRRKMARVRRTLVTYVNSESDDWKNGSLFCSHFMSLFMHSAVEEKFQQGMPDISAKSVFFMEDVWGYNSSTLVLYFS